MRIDENVLKSDERAIFGLRKLYSAYGYSHFKMSKFEEYDLYVKNKNFLVSDNVITFTDTNGKLMALKPDVTLSIVKNSKDIPGVTQKVYYDENVYRISGGSQAYKEIMQAGLECIGEIDTYCLSEVLMLAERSLAEISPDYVLDVSHLGILSEVIEEIGISSKAVKELLLCVGAKNIHGIDSVLREEGIDVAKADTLKKLIAIYGEPKKVLCELAGVLTAESTKKMLEELSVILSVLPSDKIRIDFSVVGDMRYYNGIVFKGFVNKIPTSILSGGQYDFLMRKMGKKSGAVGFAVYLDLLEELNEAKREYDVDAVILYDASADLSALTKAVKSLSESGKSVMAQKCVPEKLKYRQLYKMNESGVELLEDNA